MISVSLSGSLDPRHQQRFTPYAPKTAQAFLKTVTADCWSPIVWKGGHRLKASFESCAYVALDFDTGKPSLKEIEDELRTFGVRFLIATTKSHQKVKTTASGKVLPAVDRYRVVIPAETAVTDRELYEYNMEKMVGYFGCDKACTDAARFFYPCTEVVAFVPEGKKVAWLPFGDDYQSDDMRREARAKKLKAMGERGGTPLWFSNILDGIVTVQEGRHHTCCRLGATAAALGWELDRIVAKVLKTSLSEADNEDEIVRAVTWGYDS